MNAGPFRFRSVRAQMIAVTMLAFVGVVAALAATAVVVSGEAMRMAIDADLRRRGEDFALLVQRDRHRSGAGPSQDGPPEGGPPGGRPPGGPPGDGPPSSGPRPQRSAADWTAPAHIVVGREGPGGDGNGVPYDPKGYAEAARGHEGFTIVEGTDEPHRVFSIPVQKTGPVRDVVQVAAGMRAQQEGLEVLRWTLLATVVPLGLLLGGLASLFVVRRLLGPLRHLNAEAVRIGASGFGERLAPVGDDEFAALGHTLNRMLGNLERVYRLEREAVERLRAGIERQRQFTGDASHELKTPLAVIKTYLGVLKHSRRTVAEEADAVGAMDRAADRMNGLIGDLLTLARSDGGVAGERDALRLDLLVRETVEAIPSAEPRVRFETPEPVWVEGGPGELGRVISNLVENALRHAGTEAPIGVIVTSENGTALVAVADQGVGIAPEHLPRLFDRFYRADASRSSSTGGTGLGLAICKSIVEGHGGTIAVASAPGRGTRFTVRLPRIAPPDEYAVDVH